MILEKKRTVKRWLGFAILLSIYPFFVLLYTWVLVIKSDFEGGRHGPLDAYRHVLASTVVSYTLNERAVKFTTSLFEPNQTESNKMDRHNNQIGAHLGSKVNSFFDIEPLVHQAISEGATNSTQQNQVTWLSEDKWRDSLLW